MKNTFARIIVSSVLSILLYYFMVWNTELYSIICSILLKIKNNPTNMFLLELYAMSIVMLFIAIVIKVVWRLFCKQACQFKMYIFDVVISWLLSVIGFEVIIVVSNIIVLLNFD